MSNDTSTLLAPTDLGLPEKFTEFRPHQAELAFEVAQSSARFSLLSAPTGTGKTIVCATVARLMDVKRTLVLVGTKGLQAQWAHDFQTLGLVDIKGQSNYKCLALNRGGELESYGAPGTTCNDAPCKVGVYCSLKHVSGCLYYDTVKAASRASIVVTNYAYWLTIGRHADPLAIGQFDLLVCDEAHDADSWLSDACVVNLKKDEVRSLLSLALPPIDEGVAVWAEWAREAAIIAAERCVALKAELSEPGAWRGGQRRTATRNLLKLTSLRRDLDELALAHAWRAGEGPEKDLRLPGMQVDWVAQHTDQGAKFTPVWAHPYAESYLFRGVKKVVLSSATLTPSITKYLGIPNEESEWHESRSWFDPRRRPVIYVPTTRVDMRMNEGQVRQWINKIDTVVGARLDRKGIIATVSYARANEILKRSKHAGVMMTHSSRDTRQVVEEFKGADAPRVLVSPAMVEGWDFPGSQCNYIIIAKLPFGDGRDPVEKARRKSDKEWSNYTTALTLVQTCGRGKRSEDDLCEIFIIDDHWVWFKRSTPFPKWFQVAWKEFATVPKPLPLP
jgi:Rad3-related DNA helicase